MYYHVNVNLLNLSRWDYCLITTLLTKELCCPAQTGLRRIDHFILTVSLTSSSVSSSHPITLILTVSMRLDYIPTSILQFTWQKSKNMNDGSHLGLRVPRQKRSPRAFEKQQVGASRAGEQSFLTYRKPMAQNNRIAPSKTPASQSHPRHRPLTGASQAPSDALTAAATLVGFARAPSQPQLPALPILTRLCDTTSREESGGRSGSSSPPRAGVLDASGRRAAPRLASNSTQQSIRNEQMSASQDPVVGRNATETRVAGSSAAGAGGGSIWGDTEVRTITLWLYRCPVETRERKRCLQNHVPKFLRSAQLTSTC